MSAVAETSNLKVRAGLANQTSNEVRREANPGSLFLANKAREITEYCLAHGPECFKDWPPVTVFSYVLFHLVDGGCFTVRANGAIAGVMFAWGMSDQEIHTRAAEGLSPFAWRRSKNKENALFVAEVIGQRARLGKLFKAAAAKWPDWQSKKIFTFRDGRLAILPHEVIKQFYLWEPAKAGTPYH